MLSKILLGVGIFAAIFAMLIFSGKLKIGQTDEGPKGSVLIWGTLPEAQMNPLVQAFNPQAKTYKVSYKEVREDAFSQTLLVALSNGAGPDLIIAPYQTILAESPRLYPFPLASISEQTFKTTYVDGAALFFSPRGALALPISVEPLVLFYNRRLFSKHGIVSPPEYWDEVASIVPKLTILNSKGQFIESGIALGAPNTPYAKDILIAIVEQLGQVPVLTQYNTMNVPRQTVLLNQSATGGSPPLTAASQFFVQFADPSQLTYSWNEYAGLADDQFVAEKLAMYIGYSGELGTLRARNPRADFQIAKLPQTRGQNTFSTGLRMYGISAMRTSRNLPVALAVQAQFAGSGIAPSLAAMVGGVPGYRQYALTVGLDSVIATSMLVANGWYDLFAVKSNLLISRMIADILYNRQGASDAVNSFVSRLQDLYTPL